MLTLSVKSDVRALSKKLDALARKQLPFATAQALNATAEQVRDAQRENMRQVLDNPTPFTLNSVAIKRASKSNPVALVYVKPIAVSYLLPYEIGGKNKLNSRALIKPVGQKVNQYGNLPRTTLARLKGKPNVFIGKVQTKAGVVDGVWQRGKKTRGKAIPCAARPRRAEPPESDPECRPADRCRLVPARRCRRPDRPGNAHRFSAPRRG
ncbi:hypothetical protein [Burkholderia glumae]